MRALQKNGSHLSICNLIDCLLCQLVLHVLVDQFPKGSLMLVPHDQPGYRVQRDQIPHLELLDRVRQPVEAGEEVDSWTTALQSTVLHTRSSTHIT